LIPRTFIERRKQGIALDPTLARRVYEGNHIPKTTSEDQPKSLVIKIDLVWPHDNNDPKFQDMTLIAYTKKRDFACAIRRKHNRSAMNRIIKMMKGQGSEKALYLAAELRSKYELVLKVSEVLAAQPF